MEEKRIPPHSTEAEEAVLGSALLDPEAVVKTIEMLKEGHFYSPANQRVFRAIVDLFNHSVAPDLVTVTDWLRQNKMLDEIGGPEYLSCLVASVITTANVEHHARVVLDKAVKRNVISTAMELVKQGFEEGESAAELVDHAQNLVLQIREQGLRKDPKPIRDYIVKILETAESMKGERYITGVETGYYRLDELTSGFQRGDFVVVAGRPSMGKTAFVLNVIAHAAIKNKVPCAVFSLEMAAESLVQRMLCTEAEINMKDLQRGRLSPQDWVNLTTAAGNLHEAPVFIDDTASLTVLELKTKARRLKVEEKIQMIVVDYLQLMSAPQTARGAPSRQQEISDISRALKALAKELDVPVVVVSQLSRNPEHRDDKRPNLADLRESGAIEQDADVVLLLFREEFYKTDSERKGIAELNIAKQRNGPTKMIELAFVRECMKFGNLTPREEAVLESEPYEESF